jgi:hypothetical protein
MATIHIKLSRISSYRLQVALRFMTPRLACLQQFTEYLLGEEESQAIIGLPKMAKIEGYEDFYSLPPTKLLKNFKDLGMTGYLYFSG